MRKFFLSLLTLTFVLHPGAQGLDKIDSLNELLKTTKEDSAKVMVLANLSFYDPEFKHGLQLAEDGLALAKKIGYKKGEAQCLHQMGNQFASINNYPLALHYFIEALKLREAINDALGIARSTGGIGNVYELQGSHKKALEYFFRTLAILENLKENYFLGINYASVADVYFKMGQQDSALFFYQRSYDHFKMGSDRYQMSLSLNGLGNVHLAENEAELALSYFHLAEINNISYKDTVNLSRSYLGIAELYKKSGNFDSSILYSKRALAISQKSLSQTNVIEASKLLSELYHPINDKEAFRYLSLAMTANDSLFSNEKTAQVQNMFYNERERQKEINENKIKETEDRKHNIQYALIGIGLIIFLSLFFLLSHSVIVKTGFIKFLGVVALLLLFEFINLFLHPYLVAATNNSPLLMLLILAGIASLLVPLHHRIEKWVTIHLTEKNKKIRLAAARKTIESLEKG